MRKFAFCQSDAAGLCSHLSTNRALRVGDEFGAQDICLAIVLKVHRPTAASAEWVGSKPKPASLPSIWAGKACGDSAVPSVVIQLAKRLYGKPQGTLSENLLLTFLG